MDQLEFVAGGDENSPLVTRHFSSFAAGIVSPATSNLATTKRILGEANSLIDSPNSTKKCTKKDGIRLFHRQVEPCLSARVEELPSVQQVNNDVEIIEELEFLSEVDVLSLEGSTLSARDSFSGIPPSPDASFASSIDAEARVSSQLKESLIAEVSVRISSLGNQEEALWISRHVLATLSSDFRCSEADVQKNVLNATKLAIETATLKVLRNSLNACVNADIVVAGRTSSRTLSFRTAMTVAREEPQLLSAISNAEQIFAAFASCALDDPDCVQSCGWFHYTFSSGSGEITSLALYPTVLMGEGLFAPASTKATRLYNVFHQLLASSSGQGTSERCSELFLVPTENVDEDVIGARFNLIKHLGTTALQELQAMLRTDYFGFNTLVYALTNLGFSSNQQETIWKTCSAVLHLGGVHDEEVNWMALSTTLDVDIDDLTAALKDEHSRSEFALRLYHDLMFWIVNQINAKFQSILAERSMEAPVLSLRIFDSSDSAQLPASQVAITGKELIPRETLANISSPLETVSMRALLRVCHNERYVFQSLGSRAQLKVTQPSDIALNVAAILLEPWLYTRDFLSIRFPNAYAKEELAVLEAVSEHQWAQLELEELADIAAQMEDALRMSQQLSSDVFSAATVFGAHSLMEDVAKAKDQARELKDENSIETLHLIAKFERILSEARIDYDVKRLLCTANKESDFDIKLALATLRWSMENSETVAQSPYFTSSIASIMAKLICALRQAKDTVDRHVYRTVHSQEACFGRSEIAKLTAGPTVSETQTQLKELLEHVFSFYNCTDDKFDSAKLHADTTKALKSTDLYLKRKAEAEIVSRFLSLNDPHGVFDMERLKQQHRQSGDSNKHKEMRGVRSRATTVVWKTLQTPLKGIAKASRSSTAAQITPAGLKSMRARLMSVRTAELSTDNDDVAAERPPKNVEEETRCVDAICATAEFNMQFRLAFLSVCNAFEDEMPEAMFILCKNNLCNAFNYINDNHRDLLMTRGVFQQRVVLEVVDLCDNLPWCGLNDSGLTRSGLNRLALLAFIAFAFGGQIHPHVLASLLGWIQRKPIPDQAKSLLTEFIFGMDPVYEKYAVVAKSGSSCFEPTMVEDIWSRFQQSVPFTTPPTQRKGVTIVGTVAEALSQLAKRQQDAVPDEAKEQDTVVSVPSSSQASKSSQSGTGSQLDEEVDQIEEEKSDDRQVIRSMTEDEKRIWDREDRKRRHQEEWKANHVNCSILYDYADPDGDEMYLRVKAGEIVWIPLKPSGKKSALSQTKEWIWVERYIGEDQDGALFLDEDGCPLRTEGYVPFKYVGFPGYE